MSPGEANEANGEWSALLKKFREQLIVDEGLAENTVKSYLSDLRDFCDFAREQNLIPSDVDTFVLTDYLEYCRRGEFSGRTVSRRLASLNKFFGFLNTRGTVAGNPMEKLDRPGESESFPDYLDEEEVGSLLGAPETDVDSGLRDRALLEVLYGAGLRASEVVDLKANAIDWERGELKVTGKGQKQRVVPIGREALKWLRQFGREVRNEWSRGRGSNYFFIDDRGEKLNRQKVWNIVKNHAVKAGLDEVSPHTLRHSFATHMLARGADLRSLQKMLGHSDVGTTADIYVHLRDEIRDSHRDFHPRGQEQ